MKNLFEITQNKATNSTMAEYDSFIIRRVSQKQEDKINALGQKYNIAEKNRGLPKWLNLMNRISFSATFTSFIFLIVSLFINAKEMKESFLKEYLWIIIILSVSIVIFIVSIVLGIVFRRHNQKTHKEETAQEVFDSILKLSKQYLSVPDSAKSLEVLMEQTKEKKEEKIKMFSNVILSVFIEKEMLCFADLFVVIGIPLKSIETFDEIQGDYRFRYWHKKEPISSFNQYDVKIVTRPIRCFQANQYFILKINHHKELGIYVPPYEVDEYSSILKKKREDEA
ncbi:MAG: hypothetical protein K2J85_06465 [Anaeroplasmataceae bacterium]|nr:hypothetical protein [Anaeroplasmataceae bacterium]